MSEPIACLRRTEPSAALIPSLGQPKLDYVPAAITDIRKRIHEIYRHRTLASETRLA